MHLFDAIALAAALHAGILLAAARATPSLDDEVEAAFEPHESYGFQQYLMAQAEPDEEDLPARRPADSAPDGREPSESRCGGHRGGSMGEPTAADDGHRYGVQGPADNPDPHLARQAWPTSGGPFFAQSGVDEAHWGGDVAAPMAPWGRDDSLGTDEVSARGNMWGELLGFSFGSPGAGLGLKRLCPTCGDDGRGVAGAPSFDLDTAPGGATGTEPAHRR